MSQPVKLTNARLRTPRAAAVAGIVFSVLLTTSIILLRLAIPEDLAGEDAANWLQGNTSGLTLALGLVPFAGIAFLWFMGVVRSHLGEFEDQFFSTVFFGSGLLFLGMLFISAAIAGGILASYSIASDRLVQTGIITFGRSVMYTVTNVYAIRMAGVFMMSIATIWVRTRVMPRPFVLITYALALIMLVTIYLSLWLILIFPIWVFIISIYILALSMRGKTGRAGEVVGSADD